MNSLTHPALNAAFRILALLLTLSLSPSLPARTWTDKDGRSITGNSPWP
jgi:hypothetical protein